MILMHHLQQLSAKKQLKNLFDGLMKWPQDFQPLRKVEKLLQDKIKLFETEKKIDWATGELLAYSSLLVEGKDCAHERPGCKTRHFQPSPCCITR